MYIRPHNCIVGDKEEGEGDGDGDGDGEGEGEGEGTEDGGGGLISNHELISNTTLSSFFQNSFLPHSESSSRLH